MIYDYIIIGGGIAGSSIAYFLDQKSPNSKIAIIDKNNNIADGASGAAGAFLSPLLGKPNEFKTLVNNALRFSTNFYAQNFPTLFSQKGVLRVPKDDNDRVKFQSYKPYMDFEYTQKQIYNQDGYYFDIGSLISSAEVCQAMTKEIEFIPNTQISTLEFINNKWILNNSFEAKNIILSTGADISLLDNNLEANYIQIRPVWGQRVICTTTSNIEFNLHKAHSISPTKPYKDELNLISIGATHKRGVLEADISDEDNKYLMQYAKDEFGVQNLKLLKAKAGARASSYDYFPIIGKVIDTKSTLAQYPYLKKGSKVPNDKFSRYKNLYIFNGVGGRGFVLSPYLADKLSNMIINNQDIESNLVCDRLFIRYVRKIG